MTKPATCHFDLESVRSTKPLISRLWSFALQTTANREIGALEAADTLLGYKIYEIDSSTKIRWLNVKMNRNRRLKSYRQVKELPENSTDIFCPNFIDTHYPNRPNELEALSLHEFAKNYDIIDKEPIYKNEYYKMQNGNKFARKRKKNPYLINFWKYNPISEPENYYYSLLLLFKPWRDETNLKGDSESYTEAFNVFKSELPEAQLYHEKYLEQLKALGKFQEKLDEALEADTQSQEKMSDHIPEECVPLEVENAMKDLNDYANKIDENDLTQNINLLNEDQKRVFNKVTDALQNKQKLRMFVSGSGGTGKSFLIRTIVQWNKIKRNKLVAVMAPTGISALNIDGSTAHRLLHLPVQQENEAPKCKPLLQMMTLKLYKRG